MAASGFGAARFVHDATIALINTAVVALAALAMQFDPRL